MDVVSINTGFGQFDEPTNLPIRQYRYRFDICLHKNGIIKSLCRRFERAFENIMQRKTVTFSLKYIFSI